MAHTQNKGGYFNALLGLKVLVGKRGGKCWDSIGRDELRFM